MELLIIINCPTKLKFDHLMTKQKQDTYSGIGDKEIITNNLHSELNHPDQMDLQSRQWGIH